jgi:UDP-glucose:(heptosyl)LPS alpha-1,3-glucosyltransferase
MRIGIVIDDLDPRRGGMSQWCSQFVAQVAGRGHELHLIGHDFGDRALLSQVTCYKMPRARSRVEFATVASQIANGLDLDIVHDMGLGWHFDIFQPHGGAYEAWLARRLDFYPAWIRAFKRPFDALTARHRDFDRHWRRQYAAGRDGNKAFIALSKVVADHFIDLHGIRPEQVTLIYNGVDCRRFSPEHRLRFRAAIRRHIGVNDETLVLLLAAHNFRLKGVPQFLRIASRLAANGRPLHVLIAGGKRLERWKRVAARLGLANRATFLGVVHDLVPYFAAADAYLHPTFYDPCSLVLLEAAASGLPIVTTRRYNGAAELFQEGEEILTANDPRDFDALYERADALFDEALRTKLGAAARNVALRHSFEQNVAEILRLYETRVPRRAVA